MDNIKKTFDNNIKVLSRSNSTAVENTSVYKGSAVNYEMLNYININTDFYKNMDTYSIDPLDNYTEMLATRTSSTRSIFSAYYLNKNGSSNSNSIKNDLLDYAASKGKEQSYMACFGAPFSYLEAVDPLGRVYKDTFGIRREETWITKPNNESQLVTSNTDSKVFTAYIKVGMVAKFQAKDLIKNASERAKQTFEGSESKNEQSQSLNPKENVSRVTSFTLKYKVDDQFGFMHNDEVWEHGKVVPFNKFMYRAMLRLIDNHTSESISGIKYGSNSTLDTETKSKQLDNINTIKNKLKTIFGDGSYPYFKFICSEETVVNDSYQNGVGDSTIKTMIEGATKHAREFSFMTGGGDAAAWLQEIFGDISKSAGDNVAGKIFGSINSGISTLRNGIGELIGHDMVDMFMKGNSLVYPQIWTNSTIIKTVTMQMRFYSPYGDWNSVFMNVLLPFFIIMGFTLPRQTYPSFVSFPFAFSLEIPGLCQSEFAMVQNLSFRRGGRYDAWSESSFMRGIDITLDVIPMKPTFGFPEEAFTASFTPDTEIETSDQAKYDTRNKVYGSEDNSIKGDMTFANELRNLSGAFIITETSSDSSYSIDEKILKKSNELTSENTNSNTMWASDVYTTVVNNVNDVLSNLNQKYNNMTEEEREKKRNEYSNKKNNT